MAWKPFASVVFDQPSPRGVAKDHSHDANDGLLERWGTADEMDDGMGDETRFPDFVAIEATSAPKHEHQPTTEAHVMSERFKEVLRAARQYVHELSFVGQVDHAAQAELHQRFVRKRITQLNSVRRRVRSLDPVVLGLALAIETLLIMGVTSNVPMMGVVSGAGVVLAGVSLVGGAFHYYRLTHQLLASQKQYHAFLTHIAVLAHSEHCQELLSETLALVQHNSLKRHCMKQLHTVFERVVEVYHADMREEQLRQTNRQLMDQLLG